MSESTSVWPLRAVALLIAVLIWLFASYLPRLEGFTEKEITVDLSYAATPAGKVSQGDRPDEVTVRIRGTEDLIGPMGSDSIGVTVPLPDPIVPGVATEVFLEPANAIVPDGVEILGFSPASVSVMIDDLAEQRMRVLPEFRGEPAAGLTRDNLRFEVRPEFVVVSGPQAAVASLSRMVTEPIDVSGRAIDFSVETGVRLDDPDLTARPATVRVDVKLEAEPPPSQ